MRIRTATAAAAILGLALTGCSSSDDTSDAKATPAKSSAATVDLGAAEKSAGIPPVPTGAKRAELLRALAAANPDTVKYEDKAINAARNQCSAINGGGNRVDWTASVRFTYKDVVTTEAQGKQINAALKGLHFCDV